ncbi:hypothetical protein MG293_020784 [Ovis ammon polii]|uniref:Uncharacterized protein n=1 Tax=Ovis ammon polii TaxID=230172 RepID=A0AAD4TMQ4_OVIAM|nr:hypothetical protein MG293_020784 [Ovis ammon polii]
MVHSMTPLEHRYVARSLRLSKWGHTGPSCWSPTLKPTSSQGAGGHGETMDQQDIGGVAWRWRYQDTHDVQGHKHDITLIPGTTSPARMSASQSSNGPQDPKTKTVSPAYLATPTASPTLAQDCPACYNTCLRF